MTEKWTSDCGTVTLYCGDCLEILPTLAPGSVDAVVTDPPYSSGGQYRGDRARSTVEKYVKSGVMCHRSDFSGDNIDQRMWLMWSSWWIADCRSLLVDGGVFMSFIDWRQLPALTDSVQLAGLVWRSLLTWWKPGIRMVKGRPSNSSEFVVYATNGAHGMDGENSIQNVFACAPVVGDDKLHIAEKPLEVMRWILSATSQECLVLDPFMGSASTAIGCIASGRRFIGIERVVDHYKTAKRRIKDELDRVAFLGRSKRETQRTLLEVET